MAVAQVRQQILQALHGEPYPPPHRQNGPRRILQRGITAFHLTQPSGGAQMPELPCSSISRGFMKLFLVCLHSHFFLCLTLTSFFELQGRFSPTLVETRKASQRDFFESL